MVARRQWFNNAAASSKELLLRVAIFGYRDPLGKIIDDQSPPC